MIIASSTMSPHCESISCYTYDLSRSQVARGPHGLFTTKATVILRIPHMPHNECSPLVVDRERADRELAKVICRHQRSMLTLRKRNLNTPLD